MERAPGEEWHGIVNYPRVVINERSVHRRVVHRLTRVPAIGVHLCHPQVIRGEVARHLCFSPADHTLTRESIIGPAACEAGFGKHLMRKSSDRVQAVAGLDVKCYHRTATLTRNDRAE